MSSSGDYLLDSVISEALDLPSSIRQEYVRKALHAEPTLLSKAVDLLKGLENDAPTSFLDQPPILNDAGLLIDDVLSGTGPALKPGDYIKSFQISPQSKS